MIDINLTALFEAFITFARTVWNQIFGNWNYGILFGWLPNDIILAVDFLIIALFGIMLIKLVKDILPF